MRSAVLLAVVSLLPACGKEVNPRFCRDHPEDVRCVDALPVDATSSADSALACPAGYSHTASGQSSRYRIVDEVDDWQSAAADCANDGPTTHLAVMSSNAEVQALSSVIDRFRFVGHTDRRTAGTFAAVTDEPNVYPELVMGTSPPWASGEPSDSGSCAGVSTALAFHDRDCSNEDQAYICECDAYADDPDNY